MRKIAKAPRQIPYAAITPKAMEARLAQTSINKLIASCIRFSLAVRLFAGLAGSTLYKLSAHNVTTLLECHHFPYENRAKPAFDPYFCCQIRYFQGYIHYFYTSRWPLQTPFQPPHTIHRNL